MLTKVLLANVLLLCIASTGHSQDYSVNDDHIIYGVSAGRGCFYIRGTETTILSEPYFINYTLKSQPMDGWAVGAFVIYRRTSPIALEGNLFYTEQGTKLLFNNTEKDFNYNMQFKYQFLNVAGLVKFYPFSTTDEDKEWRGPNIGVGAQVGFNLAPENITYTSGGTGRLPAFGSDLEQQQQLRNVLKGKNDFSLVCSLAWELRRSGIMLGARYIYGLTDVIETQANSYDFIENKNTKSGFTLTVGLNFGIFNH